MSFKRYSFAADLRIILYILYQQLGVKSRHPFDWTLFCSVVVRLVLDFVISFGFKGMIVSPLNFSEELLREKIIVLLCVVSDKPKGS